MTREGTSPFDPRDPRWKTCLVGCRPAAGIHRPDCPNVSAALVRYECDHCQIAWSNQTPNPTRCPCGREGRAAIDEEPPGA